MPMAEMETLIGSAAWWVIKDVASLAVIVFGSKVGGEIAGNDGTTKTAGVTSATDLTAANVGSSWNSANEWHTRCVGFWW